MAVEFRIYIWSTIDDRRSGRRAWGWGEDRVALLDAELPLVRRERYFGRRSPCLVQRAAARKVGVDETKGVRRGADHPAVCQLSCSPTG
jgi:hypothetical protein